VLPKVILTFRLSYMGAKIGRIGTRASIKSHWRVTGVMDLLHVMRERETVNSTVAQLDTLVTRHSEKACIMPL
jgi:hypothetical protein